MPSGIYKRTEEMKKTYGMSGKKHTEKFKIEMSKRVKGKKYALGAVRSLETRMKMSQSKSGDKSYLWKGGITPINTKIRQSVEYKIWRKSVFERDDYTCIWCGKKAGNGKRVTLNADHIKPFSLYPELRFAIDNGRTLCRECHMTTDTWGKNLNKINK